jgi:hypothetical protein
MCGIRVRSEIAIDLPGADGEQFDVDVRWGADVTEPTHNQPNDVLAAYQLDDATWYTVTLDGGRYVLRFKDVGEFVVNAELSQVTVHRLAGGRVELLPILLAGTALALLLTLRGATVLHASAVVLDQCAVAFVGQSGRGKSTVAALLCRHGAKLVTDDVLVVDAGPPPSCRGDARALRLRAAAFEIAGDAAHDEARRTSDDRLAFEPDRAGREPLTLGAVVIPSPSRTADEVRLRRLSGSDAFRALLCFPRIHGWRRSEVLQRDFLVLSRLAGAVPVLEAEIPWGPPFADDVSAALSSALQQVVRG